MADLTQDFLTDRRRLRRKVTFWRAVALIVVLGAVAAAYRYSGGASFQDQIARIHVAGTITEDAALLARLEAARKSERVKGVILTVNSPGGTTAGGEAIFNAVRKLAADKPVVAQVGTLAASAGYMVAVAADHIVSRESSIVGSIGVLVQIPNVSELMDKIGVSMDAVKSSPLKAEPSPFNPVTEEEVAMMRSMVMDSYDWFVDLVTERRPLSRDEVLAIADGSIFTGRQALARKMVDSLGGVDEAKKELVARGVSDDLEIVEWVANDGYSIPFVSGADGFWLKLLAATGLLDRLGLNPAQPAGLVSIWDPQLPRMND